MHLSTHKSSSSVLSFSVLLTHSFPLPFIFPLLSLETTCRHRHRAVDHRSHGRYMVRHFLHPIRQEDGDCFPAKDYMQAVLCGVWQCERVRRRRRRCEGRRGRGWWYGVSTWAIKCYHHTPHINPHYTHHIVHRTQGGISSYSVALYYCIALYSLA